MGEISPEQKLKDSQKRIFSACRRAMAGAVDFTGQFYLEVHCKDGLIGDVYEIRSRRKILRCNEELI
jgi:hypothetical protein